MIMLGYASIVAATLSLAYGSSWDMPSPAGSLACLLNPQPRKIDDQYLRQLPKEVQQIPKNILEKAPVEFLQKQLGQNILNRPEGMQCAGFSSKSSSVTSISPGQTLPLSFQLGRSVSSSCLIMLVCPRLGYKKELYRGDYRNAGQFSVSAMIPRDAPSCEPAECFIQWTLTTCEQETFVDCADVCVDRKPIPSPLPPVTVSTTCSNVQMTQTEIVSLPPLLATTTITQMTTDLLPPPIIVETVSVPPIPVPPQVSTEVQTIFATQTIIDTETIPPATSFLTLTDFVTVTITPEAITSTESITLAPLPPAIVTETVESTVLSLETAVTTIVLPPALLTATAENFVTVTLPPQLVTETFFETAPPLPPSTVIQTVVATVPFTSTMEVTEAVTLTSTIEMDVTETAMITQTVSQTLTISEAPLPAETDFVTVTQSEQETIVTITQTSTVVQTLTQLQTFTMTSIIPSTVIITPMMLRALRSKEFTTSCVCPTLVCPTNTCTVTVTMPCPSPVNLYRNPYY